MDGEEWKIGTVRHKYITKVTCTLGIMSSFNSITFTAVLVETDKKNFSATLLWSLRKSISTIMKQTYWTVWVKHCKTEYHNMTVCFMTKLTSFSVFVSGHVINSGSSSPFISVCSFSLSENVREVSSHEMCWSSVVSKLCWKKIMFMSLTTGVPYLNPWICRSSIYNHFTFLR
jgi:hypothetical protein